MPTKIKRNTTFGKVKWIRESKINIIDEIKIDFKYTGFGKNVNGFNEQNETNYNNFDVTIQFKGKSIKLAFAAGTENLQGIVSDAWKNFFKIDILERIVIDCFPPNSFEEFYNEFKHEFQKDISKNIYADVIAQSNKLRTLFDNQSLGLLETALIEWENKHPESNFK